MVTVKKWQKLLKKTIGLIWSIVKRFSGRGYEAQDLYQIGCIGLIKSIQRFDTRFEVKLSTYAVPYILGEIKRFLRDDGPVKVSRSLKESCVRIRELQKEYMNKNGEEISLDKIAKELRISKEEIAMALESSNPVASIEAVNYRDSKTDKTINLLEKIDSGTDEASLISDKLTIKDLIKNLENKEKQLIMLRFYNEKTQTQVAKILGITQVQVSRIEKKILNKMKQELIS